MLENLDKVDWSKLQHAYGEASDIPDMIRVLTSDNAEARDKAYDDFYTNIYHQGSIYEAAAYTVPFFIELLQSPVVADKHELLKLLTTLARGGSWHESHQRFDWLFGKEREKPEFQETIKREMSHVEATYNAVVKGYQIYLDLLEHPESEVRGNAAWTLACCGEHQAEIEPKLRHCIETDPDIKLRKTFLLALKRLWLNSGFRKSSGDVSIEQRQYLLHFFHESEHLALRYAAALALADRADEEQITEIITLFDDVTQRNAIERDAIAYNVHDIMQNLRVLYPKHACDLALKHAQHPDKDVQIHLFSHIEYFGGNYRWATEQVTSILSQIIRTEDGEVRIRAARALCVMGQFAKPFIDDLESILKNESVVDSRSASRVFRDIRENRWTVEGMGKLADKLDDPIPELIQQLTELSQITSFPERMQNERQIRNIVYTLAHYGEQAKTAVPVLLQVLDNTISLTRVYAARALFTVDPSQHDAVLKVLMAELKPEPQAILVVDCLRQMGRHAAPALETLYKIAQLEHRYMRRPMVDADESLRVEVAKAIAAIESALKS